MSKIIRGTRDAKNRTILKQPQGGVGRVRCPKCQNLAIAELDGQGRQTYRCTGCGSILTSRPL